MAQSERRENDTNTRAQGRMSVAAVGKIERAQPRWVTVWFLIDAIVALAPPLYWAFDGDSTPIYGIPAAVLYFVAVSTCIAASIIAAYATETRSGEIG
jgi:hypothetical protein